MKLASLAAIAALGAAAAVVPAQAAYPKQVKVSNNAFSPKTLTVKKGTKVVWKWTQGGIAHNVTPANGKPGSKTSSKKGFSFVKVMSKTGTFKYICTIHPATMRMTVKVTS